VKLCSIGLLGRGHTMAGRIPRAPGHENIFDVAARLTAGDRGLLERARTKGGLQSLKLQSQALDRRIGGLR